jgi:Predicted membrane protein
MQAQLKVPLGKDVTSITHAGCSLMYPPSAFAVESVMLVLYCALSYLRTSLGSSGNKSESLQLLVIMMALSLPQIVFQVYMMAFQVYVCASSPPGAASMPADDSDCWLATDEVVHAGFELTKFLLA